MERDRFTAGPKLCAARFTSLCRVAATVLLGLLLGGASGGAAQPYDPGADATADLQQAAVSARAKGHLVLAVVGGNWCRWCRALDELMENDREVREELSAGFELVHVNYSKENRNEAALERLGRPDRLGFPVLVVLSPDLEVLRQQSTEGFETGDPSRPGHDREKLAAFLRGWKRATSTPWPEE